MKKSSQWLIIFFAILIVGMGGFMAANYNIDAVGYFTVERGDSSVDANGYTRAAKAKYIKKHADEYNAVVLGGSKAGVLSTERLSEYSGKNYYNFYIAYGCFSDFLTYAKFMIDTANVEEITLHLSSIEAQYYSKADENEIYQVPACVTGSIPDLVLENLNYLCRNIVSSIEYAQTGNTDKDRGEDNITNGERNYSHAYGLMKSKGREAFQKKYVSFGAKPHQKELFNDEAPYTPALAENVFAMMQLKELCEAHNVKLQVVMGPTYIDEMYKFEGEAFYGYLKELVDVIDIWDFSGFIDVDRNPYNFVNHGHYTNAVADLMVDIMYGKAEKDGFGILLTPKNIDEYIEARRAAYAECKAEYEKNGYISLFDMEHESYIPTFEDEE